MKEIIELLHLTNAADGDELVLIAKGKYEYPSTFKLWMKKIRNKINTNR
jgi:hypothetical protein